jgi:hypothetical protein
MLVTPNADKILNRLWGTNISFSVATTLLSTILIVISILKQRMPHDIPGSDAPRTAIEIIVESSAIYSIASIIWIPLRIIDGPHSPTFLLAFAVSSAFYSWSVVRFHHDAILPAKFLKWISAEHRSKSNYASRSDAKSKDRPITRRSTFLYSIYYQSGHGHGIYVIGKISSNSFPSCPRC